MDRPSEFDLIDLENLVTSRLGEEADDDDSWLVERERASRALRTVTRLIEMAREK